MSDLPRVTVWNEYRQEKTDEPVKQLSGGYARAHRQVSGG